MTNTNKGKEETDRVTEGRSFDIYRTAEEGDLGGEEETPGREERRRGLNKRGKNLV